MSSPNKKNRGKGRSKNRSFSQKNEIMANLLSDGEDHALSNKRGRKSFSLEQVEIFSIEKHTRTRNLVQVPIAPKRRKNQTRYQPAMDDSSSLSSDTQSDDDNYEIVGFSPEGSDLENLKKIDKYLVENLNLSEDSSEEEEVEEVEEVEEIQIRSASSLKKERKQKNEEKDGFSVVIDGNLYTRSSLGKSFTPSPVKQKDKAKYKKDKFDMKNNTPPSEDENNFPKGRRNIGPDGELLLTKQISLLDVQNTFTSFVNDPIMERIQIPFFPRNSRKIVLKLAYQYRVSCSNTQREMLIKKREETRLPSMEELTNFRELAAAGRLPHYRHKTEGPSVFSSSNQRAVKKKKAGTSPSKSIASGVKPIPDDNIGARMLREMGWQGGGLGANQEGQQIPIALEVKLDKYGLGF